MAIWEFCEKNSGKLPNHSGLGERAARRCQILAMLRFHVRDAITHHMDMGSKDSKKGGTPKLSKLKTSFSNKRTRTDFLFRDPTLISSFQFFDFS
jgi:hypothetical protein